jgi:tyrosyl-tRNA synthetase
VGRQRSIEEHLHVIRRGAADLINETELRERLASGRPLRVKAGFDPTAADLHLGHTVLMRKLRQIQELGHHVIFLVGDFTARIGDPSGRSETRPALSPDAIAANARTYQDQAFKILDRDRTDRVEQRVDGSHVGGRSHQARRRVHGGAHARARRLS